MGTCENYLLRRCCCCGTLRTGTLVAGFGAVILSIFTIIIIVLKMLGILANVQLRMLILEHIFSEFVIEIILIINLCVTIILSILLIVGTIKRNVYMMMPWVLLGGMLIIGLLVSVIITAVNFYTNDDNFNGTLWLILGLITFVIYSYMWYVVFSFFYQIYQETRRGAYTKDPFRRRY